MLTYYNCRVFNELNFWASYFFLFERPKNTWSVTFLILKYFTTRHEVFYSNVDNFQISKSTPEFNITQMIL